MKIAVVVRQVPDLIEPLEVVAAGDALDWDRISFLLNESDDHALEQAILLKESLGGTVAVVALDFGDVDHSLYTAAAKGADQIFKIPLEREAPSSLQAKAALLAEALRSLQVDLILVGCQAHDELEGALAPQLALALQLPYVGVIRGVQAGRAENSVQVFKEFPGAVMAEMNVRLPAVLGILAAVQPPRYVPVSRIRAAMKSAHFAACTAAAPAVEPLVKVCRLYPPPPTGQAQILDGSEEEVARQIADILAEKGILK
jgi:electron transfer flavoprotein beta subunit